MTEYIVRWEIDVDGDNHQDAANLAWEILHDPDSTATILTVERQDPTRTVTIDMAASTAGEEQRP